MRMWLFLLTAFLLWGCASAPVPDYPPDRAINQWVGRPIEDAIAAWGKPTEERFEEDRHLYIWMASHYDSRYYPANLPDTKIFPHVEGREEIACKGVMEVNEKGTVVRAAWEGYECDYLP